MVVDSIRIELNGISFDIFVIVFRLEEIKCLTRSRFWF